MKPLHSPFLEFVDHLARRVCVSVCSINALTTCALAGVILMFMAALDAWVLSCSHSGRSLGLIFMLGVGVAVFWGSRKRWSRLRIVNKLEQGLASHRQYFVTALEIAEGKYISTDTVTLNSQFRNLLLVQAAEQIKGTNSEAVVERKSLRVAVVSFLVVYGFMLAWAVMIPDMVTGLKRILFPWAEVSYTHIEWNEVPFEISDGELLVFSAVLSGRPVNAASLEIESEGKSRLIPMNLQDGLWKTSLTDLLKTSTVSVRAGDAISETRLIEKILLECENIIHWPSSFARSDTQATGMSACFPERSSLTWRFKLIPKYSKAQIELLHDGANLRLSAGSDAHGIFTVTKEFPLMGQWKVRIVTAAAEANEKKTSWKAIECKKDLPPAVKLMKPTGSTKAVSAIDELTCELSASDDWGLATMGIGLIVDAGPPHEQALPLDRKQLAASDLIKLLLARYPKIGPDHSVMVWSFAQDVAGQRAASSPIALEIQPLFRAKPESAEILSPPSEKEGEKKLKNASSINLEKIIQAQRAVTGKTLWLIQQKAGIEVKSLAIDQDKVLKQLKKLSEGNTDEDP